MNLTGQTLGNYRIIKELGRGGMAVVYLAEDLSAPTSRRVALKVLLPESARRLDILRRFHREADLCEKLRHPRIVRCYGLIQHDGYTFLVMDYMEGGTLAQRIKRGRMPWDEAVRIIEQVAEALAFAHSRGVVHRDVKPSNILFDARGHAYLSDFGVAHDEEATTLTAVGMQPGTYHYMSPEQIKGKKVDSRTDQFALATVFYQMICGYLPFSATDTFALAHLIVNEPPALLPPDLDAPFGVAAVLNKAHAKDPAERYPDILAFVDALKSLSFEETPSRVSRIPKTRPYASRSLPWQGGLKWAALAAVLVGVLVAGFHFIPPMFANQGQNDRDPLAPIAQTDATVISPMALSPQPSSTPPTTWINGIQIQETMTPTPSPTPSPVSSPTLPPMPTLIRSSTKPKPVAFPAKKKTATAPPRSSQKASQPHRRENVTLLTPHDGETLHDSAIFSWRPREPLGENEAYELAFWRPHQDPMTSGMSPVGSGPASSYLVHLNAVPFLSPGPWQWGVFLVDATTHRRFGLISEIRDFTYSPPSDDSAMPGED